jgi:hypothetical protein
MVGQTLLFKIRERHLQKTQKYSENAENLPKAFKRRPTSAVGQLARPPLPASRTLCLDKSPESKPRAPAPRSGFLAQKFEGASLQLHGRCLLQ